MKVKQQKVSVEYKRLQAFLDVESSTSSSGGNQFNGLPPASSLGTYRMTSYEEKKNALGRPERLFKNVIFQKI